MTRFMIQTTLTKYSDNSIKWLNNVGYLFVKDDKPLCIGYSHLKIIGTWTRDIVYDSKEYGLFKLGLIEFNQVRKNISTLASPSDDLRNAVFQDEEQTVEPQILIPKMSIIALSKISWEQCIQIGSLSNLKRLSIYEEKTSTETISLLMKSTLLYPEKCSVSFSFKREETILHSCNLQAGSQNLKRSKFIDGIDWNTKI